MWRSLIAYIRYRMHCKQWAHSPFVYDFICTILHSTEKMPQWKRIENARSQLKHSRKSLNFLDLGTSGRKNGMMSIRSISSIVRQSCTSPKVCRLLSRIVSHYECKHIVEFGTSLGMSTSYLASANPSGKVFTVEGCPEVSQVASQVFEFLHLRNIEQINVDFEYALEHFADRFQNIDLFFLDGNHAYVPTMKYFRFAKQYASNHTIFIFDDIHWSKEMEKAWREIVADEDVTVSIDLFCVGVVFFRKEITKQHFVLKYI